MYQEFFLNRMLHCLEQQSVFNSTIIEVLICLDQGEELGFKLSKDFVRIINSGGNSQASALNAGLAQSKGDLVAFFEDDDLWHTEYLNVYMTMFQNNAINFLSSNQLEVDEDGNPQRVIDFPTPSSWMLRRESGLGALRFDESFKWHLDNEFLGQINDKKIRRAHLLEKEAQIDFAQAKSARPDIVKLYSNSFNNVQLVKHSFSTPLVLRQVHAGSGTGQIRESKTLYEESMQEYKRLKHRYGLIPH